MPSRVRPPKRDPKPVRPPKPEPTPNPPPAPETEAAPAPGGMQPTDRILGPARGDFHSLLTRATEWRSARRQDTEAYFREVFRLCPEVGIDPSIVVAQWHLETGGGTSPHWRDKLNPGGIGVTDGGDVSIDYRTGENAARGQLLHLWAYATTAPVPPILSDYLALDPRFKLVQRGSGQTILGLQGRWATDPDYAAKLCARGNLTWPILPGQGAGPTPEPKPAPTETDPILAITGGRPVTITYGFKARAAGPWYAFQEGHGLPGNVHGGIDIPLPYGTTLYTPIAGTVVCSATGNGPGAWQTGCEAYRDVGDADPVAGASVGVGRVEVLAEDGKTSVIFGHARQCLQPLGAKVKPGDPICTIGGANGQHIHCEVRVWKEDGRCRPA